MRLYEIIMKRRLTRFSSVIPLLLPLYMDTHIWNEDEYIGKVYENKRKYIIDKILLMYTKNNKIECNHRPKWTLNSDGDQIQELDLDESDLDVKELIRHMFEDKKDRLVIPDELLIAAGITLHNTTGMQKGIGDDSKVVTGDHSNYPISGNSVPPEAVALTTKRITEMIYQAVLFCFNQDQGDSVTNEDIADYLARKGFTDVPDEVSKYICDQMPADIRTVALPLDAKKKRHYGILAKKDEQVGMAISATVEALEYLNTLEVGVKINQHDLYKWLAKSGYKKLTDNLLDLIWQAIPPRFKKASKEK